MVLNAMQLLYIRDLANMKSSILVQGREWGEWWE